MTKSKGDLAEEVFIEPRLTYLDKPARLTVIWNCETSAATFWNRLSINCNDVMKAMVQLNTTSSEGQTSGATLWPNLQSIQVAVLWINFVRKNSNDWVHYASGNV